MTLLFLGSPPFLLYKNASLNEKSFFFHLFSVYMILTGGNISQSKTVETSQFVFKLILVYLLVWFGWVGFSFMAYQPCHLSVCMETVLFLKNQFSRSTKFKCQKQFYFKQFSLAEVHSLILFDP